MQNFLIEMFFNPWISYYFNGETCLHQNYNYRKLSLYGFIKVLVCKSGFFFFRWSAWFPFDCPNQVLCLYVNVFTIKIRLGHPNVNEPQLRFIEMHISKSAGFLIEKKQQQHIALSLCYFWEENHSCERFSTIEKKQTNCWIQTYGGEVEIIVHW